MSPRARNTLLILLCVVGILVLPRLEPPPPSSLYSWDWRSVPEGPFPQDTAGWEPEEVRVRVLDGPDAAWTEEMLRSAGLLGLKRQHLGDVLPVAGAPLLLGEGACDRASLALEHVRKGGSLVTWSRCPELLAGLGLPAAEAWASHSEAVAVAGGAEGRALRDLPLPAHGHEWSAPVSGWTAVVSRSPGGVLALRSESVAVSSLDLAWWHRRLRHGNPDFAGVDLDADGVTRAADLRPFPWSSPTWRSPGADLWVEVLVAQIEALAREGLPRIWPLPSPAPSAVILGVEGASEANLQSLEELSLEASALVQWGTREDPADSVASEGGVLPSPAVREAARRWGHGLAMESNGLGLGSGREVAEAVRLHAARFEDRIERPRVAAGREALWWNSAGPPEIYAELGLWMHMDRVPGTVRFRTPGFAFGGGRPLRALGEDGRLLPILAQPVQVDRAWPALAVGQLLDDATRFRVPVAARASAEELVDLLEAALERELPVLSYERWATFSWQRLRVLAGAFPVAEQVPLLLWDPSGDCENPTPVSVLGPSGCLSPLPPR